jgi:ornithine lipid ester-linked acyl 2-hydroxylase
MSPSPLPAEPSARKRDKTKGIRGWFRARRKAFEAYARSRSKVETTPLIPNERFPWTAELEANWETIRAELDALLPQRSALPNIQDISPQQMRITADDGWKTFFFRAYGSESTLARRLCPQTAAMLDRIPGLEVAFFSVLGPRARIKPHSGGYLGLVRAHLGLKIPQPVGAARMRVGDEMIRWEEGKVVVFDDTYRHEVWNDSDQTRVVLLIDVHRPFGPVLTALNRTILRLGRLTSFVRDSKRKQREWEASFEGRAAARP